MSGKNANSNALLISFFGSHNLGDVLISSMLRDTVAKYSSVVSVNYGAEPTFISDIENLPEPRADAEPNVVRGTARRNLGRLGLARPANWVRHPLRHAAHWANTSSYANVRAYVRELMASADYVVIGGGNMLFDLDPWSRSWEFFDAYVQEAKQRGLPVFAISMGIGPFFSKRQAKACANSLAQCDFVTLRDSLSMRTLQSLRPDTRCFETVDPVFLLPEATCRAERAAKTVGVNAIEPRHNGESSKRRNNLRAYALMVDQILEDKACEQVVLFSTERNDYAFLHEIHASIQAREKCRVHAVTGFSNLMHLYQELDAVIGTRMHTLMTCYTQGIPIRGLSWQPKIDEFFRLINDESGCTALDDLDSEYPSLARWATSTKREGVRGREERADSLARIRGKFTINLEILSSLAGVSGRL